MQTDESTSPKFVDLAPVSSADNAAIYVEALNYATKNEKVFNIALTGPYGSGKSSVINTFLHSYHGKPLRLSLASFSPSGTDSELEIKQGIERSILQQIIYGVEADKLPFSRFKRIRTPQRFSLGTSLLITVGLLCAWYLFNRQTELLSGAFFKPRRLSNWFNYFCVLAVALSIWKIVHSAYTNSLGLSLKSISLKDVQIAPAAADHESILNRHLDEILYFFQSTEYDLVVIEDLDRFENPDIFTTLREINGLINANEGIKRSVRFLYALRDDIFANTDRTKFFEFIVPVIPIINHSNSIDKVIEHGKRIDLDNKLSKQFVREVSRYLSDLRLIQNIFNEYVVYSTNLSADQEGLLDANKLLAILIYKNVLPADFAALHRQDGVLAKVLRRYDEYVAKIEKDVKNEITYIEKRLETGDQQVLRDEAELRKVYAMSVVERVPADHGIISTPDVNYPLNQLVTGELLEKLIALGSMTVLHPNGYSRQQVNLKQLENDVDPSRSFEDRKNEIRNKSVKVRAELVTRIDELEKKIAALRSQKFNEVVRESAELIDEVFAEVGSDRDLLKYLILDGYLDDTYYQYISLFHKGRLSPNDHYFLIKIRGFDNPPPDFTLDNVAEVVASMRADDFGQQYVLNRLIMDHLLENMELNTERVDRAMRYIAANFTRCRDFFRSYYSSGRCVDKFIGSLMEKWPGLVTVALGDIDAASHAARILAYASTQARNHPKNKPALQSFLSENADRVLAEPVKFEVDLFQSLSIEILEVEALAKYPEAFEFVTEHGLYRLSIDNLRHIFQQRFPDHEPEVLEVKHLSTLNETGDTHLLNRIESDFPGYVERILLRLEKNTEEESAAIQQVLGSDDVDYDLREEFLLKQTYVFRRLEDLPYEFQEAAFVSHHIEPTWENCLSYLESDLFKPNVLTSYLQSDDVSSALLRLPMLRDDEGLPLRRFIIGNDALELDLYRSYVRLLPTPFDSVFKVDITKVEVLILERKLSFNPAVFKQLETEDLQVLFVALNFEAYAEKKADYSLTNDFGAKLLNASITDQQKLEVLSDVDEAYVARRPELAAVVGQLLARSSSANLVYEYDFMRAVVVNSPLADVQISLLNKFRDALSVSEVREILRDLPPPFRDIAVPGKSPKLEYTGDNWELAGWLTDRKLISSYKRASMTGEIKINTFRKFES